ncbi:ABC transporter permease [Catenulispora yoronensis]|uniref:ABC transporter permease n=1 Tax=Catenulispora yoronensis TaxID=450799 RepID=A0ABN2U397_9ACTN
MNGLIWLTWRQHRWTIVVTAALTVVLAVLMVLTASKLGSMAAHCASPDVRCTRAKTEAVPSRATYLMNSLVFLPLLIAVFWGVPLLAREFEQRTLPLAWSQDVSRQKWLFGKTGVMIALVGSMAALLAGLAEHLAHQYHAYTGESLFEGTQFQAGGWMPLTLALAWLAVGIGAGAATRRTLAGIAVVGALWIARMVVMVQARGKFATPVTTTHAFTSDFGDPTTVAAGAAATFPNDMSLDGGSPPFIDSHGAVHTARQVMEGWCSDTRTDIGDCLRSHGIVGTISKYQPAHRMGTFHLIENGLNLALFVVGLAVAWWCVKRTRTTVS